MHVQPPEPPFGFCLRLDVYPPPQVLQTNWRVCHSPLPSFCQSRYQQLGRFAPRTLLRFTATTSPSATLSPSADFPVSPVIRLSAPPVSEWDEEGFSSCTMHPCRRAVATTPPECRVAVGQFAPRHAAFARHPRARPLELDISRPPLPSLSLRPDDSLTILSMALSMDSQGSVSFPLAIQATGLSDFCPGGFRLSH